MKALLMAVALVGMLGSGGAIAADYDGNKLLGQCQQYIKAMDGEKHDQLAFGLCGGFVQGVSGAVMFLRSDLGNEAKFCVPFNVTFGQQVRIVVKWLQDNPKQLHKGGVELVWLALHDAYPCNN